MILARFSIACLDQDFGYWVWLRDTYHTHAYTQKVVSEGTALRNNISPDKPEKGFAHRPGDRGGL